MGPIGPGSGGMDGGHLVGRFAEWNRKATPTLVLRINGAGMLQTFADISASGEFRIPLPEIPAAGDYGSRTCGSLATGLIVVATDFSLLTNRPGFASPGRWDKGMSEIGMAMFADEAFARNIGRPGGKGATWMHSMVARTVAVGECNNSNSFELASGWNAFTIVSGPDGGPHTYHAGLDESLGWYWFAFSEDTARQTAPPSPPPAGNTQPGDTTITAASLYGEWDGKQVDVVLSIRLDSTGAVHLQSTEGGRTRTMQGTWSVSGGEFVLRIPEGLLRFNIARTGEAGFRLFGKDASSEIVFTRKRIDSGLTSGHPRG